MSQLRTLLALLLVGATVSAQNPAESVESFINERGLESTIRFLSHDLLEGRGVGTRGDGLSRLYIQTQFELFGLVPAGTDGSWEQEVPIVGITAKVDRPLSAKPINGSKGLSFKGPTDFVVNAARPDAFLEWKDAELVFVGYGITAPEQNWDDFKDVDVKGKVLLVMNNDPADDPNLFAGKTRLYYGRWSYKFEEAARRGAVGAIVIHTTPSAGYPFQVIQAGFEKEDFHLPFGDGPTLALDAWCSEDAARQLAALGGKDLDQLRAAAERRDFKPVPLGVTVDCATKNTVRELTSANVLGVLPGSDPTLNDTAVVVTAHFDHLGIGKPRKGDTIYNGALDNASGTAAMLNVARALSHLKPRPKRSILFAAVTAEESGLLGSKFFARHPTWPRRKMVANYNIDGINIWGATRDIGLVGYGKNTLSDLVSGVARRRGRVCVPDPDVDKGLFYRSDHFSFARIGVPSAFFKAGNAFYQNTTGRRRIKLAYTGTKYHTQLDEMGKGWNLGGAVEDTRLILECLTRTANDPVAPKWAPGDEFEKLR